MLDEVKKQRLISLINASSILSAQEKTDWLSLLELMNDKQLAELEEILVPQQKPVAPKPATGPVVQKNDLPRPVIRPKVMPRSVAVPTPVPVQTPSKTVLEEPSLSHISNLPSQISHQRIAPPTRPSVQPAGQGSSQAKPVPQPLSTNSVPQAIKPVVKPSATQAVPVKRTEVRQVTPVVPVFSIESVEDLAKVTSQALAQSSRKNFYMIVSQLANQLGYFQTLQYIEASPLYKSYLEYGKKKLSGADEKALPLTQDEFEFMTDILLSLKVNRM